MVSTEVISRDALGLSRLARRPAWMVYLTNDFRVNFCQALFISAAILFNWLQGAVNILIYHVTFWLLLKSATGAQRAEGSPSPLSAHGGSIGIDFQLVCTSGRR